MVAYLDAHGGYATGGAATYKVTTVLPLDVGVENSFTPRGRVTANQRREFEKQEQTRRLRERAEELPAPSGQSGTQSAIERAFGSRAKGAGNQAATPGGGVPRRLPAGVIDRYESLPSLGGDGDYAPGALQQPGGRSLGFDPSDAYLQLRLQRVGGE